MMRNLSFYSDVESRPWDFQAEECSLRCAVDQFNHRRYQRELPNGQQQMQQSVEKSASDPYAQEVPTYFIAPKIKSDCNFFFLREAYRTFVASLFR